MQWLQNSFVKKKKKKKKKKKSTADALFKVSKIKLRRQLLGELGCQMVLWLKWMR